MFGFAAVAETPFSAELTKYTIGVDLANVSAASALNSPQFSGGVNLPALTGVSATLTNATLDINGKANITTANVASTTSIAALTSTGAANFTLPANTAAFTANVPNIEGIANTNLPSQTAISSAVFGDNVQPTGNNYTVTVANSGSGNKFYIDGVEAAALTLTKGLTYVFDVSDSSNSGHPFRFKDTFGNSYTTGVTTSGTAGSSGATVTLVVPTSGAMPARYYCTVHGNGMGNTISTVNSTTTFTVTVVSSGGNKFALNGIVAPTLQLVRGTTYTFDLSDSSVSGHPLAFKSGNNSYTTGVTSTGTPGQAGASVTFAVPLSAPGIGLRYYCTVHGNAMGNSITTSGTPISLTAQGKATTPPTSVAAVLANAVPSITGLAFFTLPDINATIAQNLDDPIGVLFPFDDFAANYSRYRTVTIIAPTIGTRTVIIPAENRTVVIRPVRTDNVVYILN
jgi:cell wall-associated NlpC family hydrolase